VGAAWRKVNAPSATGSGGKAKSAPGYSKHRVFTGPSQPLTPPVHVAKIVYKPKGVDMKTTKLAAVCSSAFLLFILASTSGARKTSNRRPPAIRVYSSNGSYALETTSYVTP